jgi:hypothetical protein
MHGFVCVYFNYLNIFIFGMIFVVYKLKIGILYHLNDIFLNSVEGNTYFIGCSYCIF